MEGEAEWKSKRQFCDWESERGGAIEILSWLPIMVELPDPLTFRLLATS
jgi:hypothetical protein